MRTQWAKVYFGCRRLQPFPTCLGRLVLVQSLSRVQFFVTPWTEARQAPLFFSISRSLPKFMSIESVILFNHLILCCLLLLLPSIFPSIRIFSIELALRIRWPKNWSFSFSISSSNEYWFSFRIDWFNLLAVQGTLKSLLQHHSSKSSILLHSTFFMVSLSHLYMTARKTISSVQFSHFFDPMDCSTSGFPIHHQLPELSQTHVYRVSDAIQPSHPLSSPSPPALNLSQHQGLF